MSQVDSRKARGRLHWAGLVGLVAVLSLSLMPGVAEAAKGKKKKASNVNVMSRNIYLGADLTPALQPGLTIPQFLKAAGDVWNQVQRTDFPTRAKSLATEIKGQKAQLVGLQEAALWRTNIPPSLDQQSTAEVYNFTDLLLAELNKKAKTKAQCNAAAKKRAAAGKSPKACDRGYVVAVTKDELDFETPVNDSGTVNNNPAESFGATKDIRLTMRDAILIKKGEVKVSNASSGTFSTLFTATTPLGPVAVTRGWVALDAKVSAAGSKGKQFHFVNTHFEAFDSAASNPSTTGPKPKGGVREAQAQELLAGPLKSALPVVLVGDLNSDFPLNGNQLPGDDLGFKVLTAGGFTERAITPPPFGCCIDDPELRIGAPVGVDHRVDHVMSNSPGVVFKGGAITSTFANGLWSSDHFGVASALRGLTK